MSPAIIASALAVMAIGCIASVIARKGKRLAPVLVPFASMVVFGVLFVLSYEDSQLAAVQDAFALLMVVVPIGLFFVMDRPSASVADERDEKRVEHPAPVRRPVTADTRSAHPYAAESVSYAPVPGYAQVPPEEGGFADAGSAAHVSPVLIGNVVPPADNGVGQAGFASSSAMQPSAVAGFDASNASGASGLAQPWPSQAPAVHPVDGNARREWADIEDFDTEDIEEPSFGGPSSVVLCAIELPGEAFTADRQASSPAYGAFAAPAGDAADADSAERTGAIEVFPASDPTDYRAVPDGYAVPEGAYPYAAQASPVAAPVRVSAVEAAMGRNAWTDPTAPAAPVAPTAPTIPTAASMSAAEASQAGIPAEPYETIVSIETPVSTGYPGDRTPIAARASEPAYPYVLDAEPVAAPAAAELPWYAGWPATPVGAAASAAPETAGMWYAPARESQQVPEGMVWESPDGMPYVAQGAAVSEAPAQAAFAPAAPVQEAQPVAEAPVYGQPVQAAFAPAAPVREMLVQAAPEQEVPAHEAFAQAAQAEQTVQTVQPVTEAPAPAVQAVPVQEAQPVAEAPVYGQPAQAAAVVEEHAQEAQPVQAAPGMEDSAQDEQLSQETPVPDAQPEHEAPKCPPAPQASVSDLSAKAESMKAKGKFELAGVLYCEAASQTESVPRARSLRFEALSCFVRSGNVRKVRELTAELESSSVLTKAERMKLMAAGRMK